MTDNINPYFNSINNLELKKTVSKYPYIVDITGIYAYMNECDVWLKDRYGESDTGKWSFYFNYYRNPFFENYGDGPDYAMFSKKEYLFEFMIHWK